MTKMKKMTALVLMQHIRHLLDFAINILSLLALMCFDASVSGRVGFILWSKDDPSMVNEPETGRESMEQ